MSSSGRPMSAGIRLNSSLAPRRVALDAQLAVEEERARSRSRPSGSAGRVGLAELVDLVLQLLVDGGQLLVDRLQLLLAGLELLGRRAQLLVDRLQLLVAGLQLLGRGFVLLDRVAQLLPCAAAARCSSWRAAARASAGSRRRRRPAPLRRGASSKSTSEQEARAGSPSRGTGRTDDVDQLRPCRRARGTPPPRRSAPRWRPGTARCAARAAARVARRAAGSASARRRRTAGSGRRARTGARSRSRSFDQHARRRELLEQPLVQLAQRASSAAPAPRPGDPAPRSAVRPRRGSAIGSVAARRSSRVGASS